MQRAAMKFGRIHERGGSRRFRITLEIPPEGTLRAILKQADVSVDEFLNAR